MIQDMQENVPYFPSELGYFFRKFAEINQNESGTLQRLEIIFLDCILVPAVSFPKVYGILPESFYFDMNPNGPARSLQYLAQTFRLILHPAHASMRYTDVSITDLSNLPLKELIFSLSQLNSEIQGLSVIEISSLLNIHSLQFLFSIRIFYF